jgi:hypothetical protein
MVNDVLIAEPNDLVSEFFQQTGPLFIVIELLVVDVPVDLDDEQPIGAAKVDDERPKGMLSTKLQPIQSSIAQRRPERTFRRRHPLPQIASLAVDVRYRPANPSIPTLPLCHY